MFKQMSFRVKGQRSIIVSAGHMENLERLLGFQPVKQRSGLNSSAAELIAAKIRDIDVIGSNVQW